MKAKTIVPIAVGGAFVVLVGFFVAGRSRESFRDAATARLKEHAVAEVARLTGSLDVISNQAVSMARLTDAEDRWLSPHLIIMKNGEWVAFFNRCSKEEPTVRDTFVCRASNGNWYESTFHFCKEVIVLRMDGQPDDLRSFISSYKLTMFPDSRIAKEHERGAR